MKRMALATLCVIGIAACDSPVAPTSTPSAPSLRQIGTQTSSDLGVFGTDVSAAAYSINVDGSTTGISVASSGQVRAFLINTQVGPQMIDLGAQSGSLANISDAYGFGINSGRHVIGTAIIGGTPRAFFWDNTLLKMSNLGTLGGTSSVGLGINDKGNMVGFSTTASGLPHGFYYGKASGSMRDIGTLPGGTMSFGEAVSPSNVVVGYGDGVAGTHAFRWSPTTGVMTDLGVLTGHVSSAALGVNDSSEIVGFSYGSDGQTRAVYWPATGGVSGSPVDITPPNFQNAVAFAISKQGEIIGYGQDMGNGGLYQAFIYTAQSGAVTLGGLLGGAGSYAQSINANGQAAGIMVTSGGAQHAARWKVNLR